jgi:hypothetical protein
MLRPRSRLAWIGGVFALTSLAGLATLAALDVRIGVHDGVVLVGSAAFVQETRDALTLLFVRDPEAHAFVVGSLDAVVSGRISRVYPTTPLDVTTMSARTRAAGTTWYASSLAHEAYHVYQYDEYVRARTPWQGREAERQCLVFQYGVAQRLGATASALDHINYGLNLRYWDVQPVAQTW